MHFSYIVKLFVQPASGQIYHYSRRVIPVGIHPPYPNSTIGKNLHICLHPLYIAINYVPNNFIYELDLFLHGDSSVKVLAS